MVIENTAFLSDLALFFPKIAHKLYDRKEELETFVKKINSRNTISLCIS